MELVIQNTSGIVQIDGEYRNYQLINKGVATPDTVIVSPPGEYMAQYKSLQFTGLNNPIMVIRCADYAYVNQNVSGGTHTFTLYRDKAKSSTISWWLFDDVKPAAAAGGLTMRNAANEVVFSSDAPPFRVAGLVEHDSDGSGSSDYLFTAGRTYAYTPCRLAESVSVNVGPGGTGSNPTVAIYDAVSGCKAMTGGVSMGAVVWFVFAGNYNDAPQADPWVSSRSVWLIVDVTDL